MAFIKRGIIIFCCVKILKTSVILHPTKYHLHSFDLMPYKSFYLLSLFPSEYGCWEIMFWMEAFPLCSAAYFILTALLKALKPQAYPSTHLSHSTFCFSLCAPHFRPLFFSAPFSLGPHKLQSLSKTQVILSSLYKNKKLNIMTKCGVRWSFFFFSFFFFSGWQVGTWWWEEKIIRVLLTGV